MKPSSKIDTLILERILHTLNEDRALETFFDSIPGFCDSELCMLPLIRPHFSDSVCSDEVSTSIGWILEPHILIQFCPRIGSSQSALHLHKRARSMRLSSPSQFPESSTRFSGRTGTKLFKLGMLRESRARAGIMS